ncbi:MAG: hypothetical protein EAY81_03695 [Bacteroidetes bacterium]|nr:MAG: hypothetical protein EAY81_03695 [Bacteroidota bacterium]
MKTIIKHAIIGVLLVIGYHHNIKAQDIFGFSSSIQYVHHLIETNEYLKAQTELKRMEAEFGKSDTIAYLFLLSMEKAGKPSLLKLEIEKYLRDGNDFEQTNEYAIMMCFSHDWPDLVHKLYRSKTSLIADSNWIAFYYDIYQQDTSSAKNRIIHLDTQYFTCTSPELLLQRYRNLVLKRPGLAAGLSAIIPGLGKVYAKQPKNGLVTFFTVGALGFQAASGLALKGVTSIYGWIYVGAASVFYLGNIYGGYYAAKRYNQHHIQLIRNEVKTAVNCYFNR